MCTCDSGNPRIKNTGGVTYGPDFRVVSKVVSLLTWIINPFVYHKGLECLLVKTIILGSLVWCVTEKLSRVSETQDVDPQENNSDPSDCL